MASASPNGNASTALRNIGIAAVVLGGIYAAYATYVDHSKTTRELGRKAHDLIEKDNPGEYAQAAKKLDEALAVRGKDKYAVGARAMVASILWGEYGVEAEKAKAAEYTEKSVAMKLHTKEAFLGEGLFLALSGRAAEAEKQMTALVEKGLTPAEVIEPLGVARARQGRADAARNDFKQAAEREWRTARYTALFGDAFFEAGDFANASSTYRKALEVQPAHVRSLIGKARADAARGDAVDEAWKTLTELEGKPADELPPVMKARVLAGKAEVLLAQGKYAEAEQAAQVAIQAEVALDPASAFAHDDLGVALARQKKDGALVAFKKAISIAPTVARFSFRGALELAAAGQADSGRELLDLWAKNNKADDDFQLARGDFLVATGELSEAVKAFDAALADNAVSAEAWYKKGYALRQLALKAGSDKKKLYDGVREAFEKAVGIRESYPEVYRQIGLVYLDENPRSGEATANFGKALEFYKQQKAPKAVFQAFIAEVAERYKKAGLKGNADAWVKEASVYMN
jgi:tetratricopeptide (TPR) repeat protein